MLQHGMLFKPQGCPEWSTGTCQKSLKTNFQPQYSSVFKGQSRILTRSSGTNAVITVAESSFVAVERYGDQCIEVVLREVGVELIRTTVISDGMILVSLADKDTARTCGETEALALVAVSSDCFNAVKDKVSSGERRNGAVSEPRISGRFDLRVVGVEEGEAAVVCEDSVPLVKPVAFGQ